MLGENIKFSTKSLLILTLLTATWLTLAGLTFWQVSRYFEKTEAINLSSTHRSDITFTDISSLPKEIKAIPLSDKVSVHQKTTYIYVPIFDQGINSTVPYAVQLVDSYDGQGKCYPLLLDKVMVNNPSKFMPPEQKIQQNYDVQFNGTLRRHQIRHNTQSVFKRIYTRGEIDDVFSLLCGKDSYSGFYLIDRDLIEMDILKKYDAGIEKHISYAITWFALWLILSIYVLYFIFQSKNSNRL